MQTTKFIGDKYYICKAALSSDNFTVSDGEKEVMVGDVKDYYFVGSRDFMKNQNGFCLVNFNKKMARIYVISEEGNNGSFKIEKVYEKTYTKSSSFSEKHFDFFFLTWQQFKSFNNLLTNERIKEIFFFFS